MQFDRPLGLEDAYPLISRTGTLRDTTRAFADWLTALARPLSYGAPAPRPLPQGKGQGTTPR